MMGHRKLHFETKYWYSGSVEVRAWRPPYNSSLGRKELQRWSPCYKFGRIVPGLRRPFWSSRHMLTAGSSASWIATATLSSRHHASTAIDHTLDRCGCTSHHGTLSLLRSIEYILDRGSPRGRHGFCSLVPNSLDRDGSSCHRDNLSVVVESILDRDGHAAIAAKVFSL